MDQDREYVRELFKSMSTKEKLIYLAENYWRRALIAIVILAAAISIIGHFTWNRDPESALGIGTHAKYLDPDIAQELRAYANDKYGNIVRDKEAIYTYWFYANYAANEVELVQTTQYQLVGAIGVGQLDVMLGDVETLKDDIALQYMLDLREIFTEEELQKIEEIAGKNAKEGENGIRLFTYEITDDYGRTEQVVKDVPFLINVTHLDTRFDDMLLGNEVFLGVIVNTENIPQTKAFIWTLLGEAERAASAMKELEEAK